MKLRGERLHAPAMVALFTGMRLGEVLALTLEPGVDLEGKVIHGPRGAGADEGARRSLQGAEVQGWSPRYHLARHPWSTRCVSTAGPCSNCR